MTTRRTKAAEHFIAGMRRRGRGGFNKYDVEYTHNPEKIQASRVRGTRKCAVANKLRGKG